MKDKNDLITLSILLILTVTILFINPSDANELNKNTINLKLYGAPLNYSTALNIELEFSNPLIAKLGSEAPGFEAIGATKLISEANQSSNKISIIWDGFLEKNELKIIAMVIPGNNEGSTNIRVKKVEIAGGQNITDSIVSIVEPGSLINTSSSGNSSEEGGFTFLGPDSVTGPGKVAVAFKINGRKNFSALKLNNSYVDIVENDVGIAVIDLPSSSGNKDLDLSVSYLEKSKIKNINIGKLKIKEGIMIGEPPKIFRAYANPYLSTNKLNIRGEKFGIRRFGKENTEIEIVPKDTLIKSNKLTRKRVESDSETHECISRGSYVNIYTPAGTDTKKIDVRNNCSN